MNWLRALLYRLLHDPDPVDAAYDDAAGVLNVQRAQPWTGDETQPLIAGSPAVVAGDDLVVSQCIGAIHEAAARYRDGADLGGAYELTDEFSRHTPNGWRIRECPDVR